MRELFTPPAVSFGRPFRILEEEAYPQVIPNDDDDDARMGYSLLEAHTKFYPDFGHDSFLMEGAYSLVPTEPFYIPLPPSPPLLTHSNEINVTGPTSATVIIHGLFFQDQVKKTLRRMNEECLNASGKTIELSIEVTDNCDINVGREIMGELLGIVKLCIGKAYLVVPKNPHDANAPDTLTTSASFETPYLRSISWKGDARYFPTPWRSISNLPFPQLTHLNLEYDISVDDCTEILYRCESAVDLQFSVHKDCHSFMKHTFRHQVGRSGRIVMDNLQSLDILSPASCRPLINIFHFVALKHLNVSTGNNP